MNPSLRRLLAGLTVGSVAAIAPARGAWAQRVDHRWHAVAVQAPVLAWPQAPRSLFAITPARTDTLRIPPTYWREGALVGGGFLGILTAVAGVQLCGYEGACRHPVLSAVGGFAFGALVGSGLGALIGGQFPKPAEPAR